MGDDENQYQDHGHPVLAGAASAIGITILLYNSRAYLTESSGQEAADRFFRKLRTAMRAAVTVLAVLWCAAAIISYASLTAAIGIAIAALVISACLLIGPVSAMFCYAGKHLQDIGRARNYLR